MEPKTNAELRKFGLVMTVAFAVVGGILFWREKFVWQYAFYVSAVFLAGTLFYPAGLKPVEHVWMKLAHILGLVVTHILVTLTFYLVIMPIGVSLRVFGKDLLNLKFDREAQSYWIKIGPDDPSSRPTKPY